MMFRFIIILMTFGIALPPALAGSFFACAPHECACPHMTSTHAAPSTGPVPGGCDCLAATDAPCCLAEKNVPAQPVDLLPPERLYAPNPTLDSGGAATVDMWVADGSHGPASTSRHQRRAPPPLAFLLHQSFLI